MNEELSVSFSEYLPLREVVFNSLKDAIISGKLKPGERLLENSLSEKLGVSRTPIREALRKLELENLVMVIPRRGAKVKAMSEKEIKDVLEIRANLEALAAKLAALRITDEEIIVLKNISESFKQAVETSNVIKMAEHDEAYHQFIFDCSRNEKLTSMIRNLQIQIHRFRIAYLKDKKEASIVLHDHEALFQAITTRNEQLAQNYATEHIKHLEKAIITILKAHHD